MFLCSYLSVVFSELYPLDKYVDITDKLFSEKPTTRRKIVSWFFGLLVFPVIQYLALYLDTMIQ